MASRPYPRSAVLPFDGSGTDGSLLRRVRSSSEPATPFKRGCRANPLLSAFLARRAEDHSGMAQNLLGCDRDPSLLLPPDPRDWLDEDHLAWFVIEAIEELDLEPFYAAYRADGHGRAAHDPKMMLMLLAFAYCVGERSSRGIERRRCLHGGSSKSRRPSPAAARRACP